MAIKSGFFTSASSDRLYGADDFNGYFDGIISDGVFQSYKNALAVTVGTGLQILVGTGKARVNSHFIENTASYAISINTAHATLNRYTAIVLRIDESTREGTIVAVDGANASTPTEYVPVRTSTIYEMILAQIYISAGATSISSGNITDKRADSTVCGWASLGSQTSYTGSIEIKQGTTTLTSNTSYVTIPASCEYVEGDAITVYRNGVLDTLSYTVVYRNNVYQLQYSGSISSGTVMAVVCYKLILNS